MILDRLFSQRSREVARDVNTPITRRLNRSFKTGPMQFATEVWQDTSLVCTIPDNVKAFKFTDPVRNVEITGDDTTQRDPSSGKLFQDLTPGNRTRLSHAEVSIKDLVSGRGDVLWVPKSAGQGNSKNYATGMILNQPTTGSMQGMFFIRQV